MEIAVAARGLTGKIEQHALTGERTHADGLPGGAGM